MENQAGNMESETETLAPSHDNETEAGLATLNPES